MKRTLRNLAVLALLGAPTAWLAAPAPGQQAEEQARPGEPTQLIKGKWQATVGGKPYTLDLRVEDGDLLGSVVLPDGKTIPIEDGICVSEEFSFTTVEGEVEWEWSGTISESSLEGERERFDTDATEAFTAKRLP